MDRRELYLNLPRGNAQEFRVAVQTVELRDGTSVTLPFPGVTAVVGANNVGKSTLLRELSNCAVYNRMAEGATQIVKRLGLFREGTSEDLLSWLFEHCPFEGRKGRSAGFFSRGSSEPTDPHTLLSDWDESEAKYGGGLGNHLAPLLAFYTDAGGRQGHVQGQQCRAEAGDPPSHPVHFLQDDPGLVHELSDLSEKIFRKSLTLDVLSGNINLRVGSVAVPAPPVDGVTPEYRDALTALPKLAEQGDGMRSLLGLLIPIVCSSYSIVIVDEPEAFLHPPQASALGRALAKLAKQKNLQIILATHDRNLLTGLLEHDVDVSVVKLDRREDTTTARQLNNEQLRELWVDPALRYTNALEGLFHRLVVLMEADPDCHFFKAALEHLDADEGSALPSSEVLFVPCGGKAGMAKLARSLKGLDVPIVASPDLDVLNDVAVLKALVRALGGDWESFEDLHRKATNQFRQPRAVVSAKQVLLAITETLQEKGEEPFDEEMRRKVCQQLSRGESPWKALKDYGMRAFKGEARSHADRLLDSFEDHGLIVLREGELESLAPGLGVRKGPAWLPAALDAECHRKPAPQEHVRRMMNLAQ